jgi:protein-S-isoprenylcysteine O-methyltransferase Ste14
MKRWLIPLLVLPGSVLLLIPGLLLLPQGNVMLVPASQPRFWCGIVAAVPGLLLAISAMAMFANHGEGTPAPWDPPAKLVIRGPYRHVRNPMISGVVFLLLAEALLLGSDYIMSWAIVFWLGNNVYFPLVEERRLRERFGADYDVYCKHVRRWWPRIRPWRSEDH